MLGSLEARVFAARHITKKYIIMSLILGTPYPREIKKTLVGALFMCFNFLATTISLSITHERVPQTDPLPDIILDFFHYQYWALTASEVLLSIQSVTAFLICIFHKHR